jgi:hypothetical protein
MSSLISGIGSTVSSVGRGINQIGQGYLSGFGQETGASNLGGIFSPIKPAGTKTKNPATGVTSSTPTVWQNLGVALGRYGGRQTFQQSPGTYEMLSNLSRPKRPLSPEDEEKAWDWIKNAKSTT